MSEASIAKKREMMKLCHELIPLMKEEELASMAIVLDAVCNRIIKDVE